MLNLIAYLVRKPFLSLALLLGLTQSLSANEYLPLDHEGQEIQDYSESEERLSDAFKFKISLLYLEPSVDQSAYVVTSTNNRFGGEVYPDGKRHLISTDYKPGFRIEGLYKICNERNLLDLRFTYLNARHSRSTTGDFLFDAIGFPGDGAQSPEDTTYAGTARLHHHYKYYAADATFNRLTFDFCPDNLSFIFGLHYAYINFKQTFTSVGDFINDGASSPVNNRLTQKSSFWGIGPQIGIDYNYFLPVGESQIVLNASVRASLLYSSTHADLHYTTARTGSVGVNLHNDKLGRVNPAVDALLGVSYHTCCYGLQTTFEIGYEFLWYSKCVDKITGYDVAYAGDTFDVLDDLSLHGPILSMNVAF